MKFQLVKDVTAPSLATEGAAGYDLYLPKCSSKVVVHPKQTETIYTGVKVQIPKFHVGFLLPRSSTGCKGLSLQNSMGVIDSDFTGEVQVRCRNWNELDDLVINPDERFAQLVVVPCLNTPVEIVEELSETSRGSGGFGSSGV